MEGDSSLEKSLELKAVPSPEEAAKNLETSKEELLTKAQLALVHMGIPMNSNEEVLEVLSGLATKDHSVADQVETLYKDVLVSDEVKHLNELVAEKQVENEAHQHGIAPQVYKARKQAEERVRTQLEAAQRELRSFVGERVVNGLLISLKWGGERDGYQLSLPELQIDETNVGMFGRRLSIINDPKIAKSVFDSTCDFAEHNADPLEIFKYASHLAAGIYGYRD
ncbi:MAG: hypothetical protein JWN50_549 [Parcubacteria group bacterium]|nr:hypothetical protein [Parcubacteria group bacterium]